jgi:hypothetical protein
MKPQRSAPGPSRATTQAARGVGGCGSKPSARPVTGFPVRPTGGTWFVRSTTRWPSLPFLIVTHFARGLQTQDSCSAARVRCSEPPRRSCRAIVFIPARLGASMYRYVTHETPKTAASITP